MLVRLFERLDSTAVIVHQSSKQHIRPGLFHQQHFHVHKQTSYTKHVFLGPNSRTILRQSCDNFRTCDNLMTTGEFTEHLRQS